MWYFHIDRRVSLGRAKTEKDVKRRNRQIKNAEIMAKNMNEGVDIGSKMQCSRFLIQRRSEAGADLTRIVCNPR